MYKIILFFLIIIILGVFNILKHHVNERFSNNKKYLEIECTIKAGLSHQMSNLYAMLKEAKHRNITLILPHFKLHGCHNNNKELLSNLTEYYNFDKLKINGEKMIVVKDGSNIDPDTILKLRINDQLITNNKKLIFDRTINYNISIPYQNDILSIAENVSNKLGKLACVHVRRGDMLKFKPNLDNNTQSKKIISKLKKYDFDNVYIMTNEKQLGIFDDVKKKFNTYFFKDFDILKNEPDNYRLFAIEKCIMENASIRISTFKVKNSYYDDYLSEITGFQ